MGKDDYAVVRIVPGDIDMNELLAKDRQSPLWRLLAERTKTPADEVRTVLCVVIGRSADGTLYHGGAIEGELTPEVLEALDELRRRVVGAVVDSGSLPDPKERPS
jgi:hypothetical protein